MFSCCEGFGLPPDLKGKTCIVTGASRGIGRGCAVALGGAGCRVAVNYRERADEAGETCRLIEEAGGEAHPVQADVSDEAQVRRLVDETRARFGPVSILVNNAGVAIKKPFEELTESDWDATLDHAPDELEACLAEAALSEKPFLIDAVVKPTPLGGAPQEL